MTAPASYFTFPGIHGFRSGSYALKPGTDAGIAWIYTPMSAKHGSIPKRGTLTIHYGSTQLRLNDCTLDDVKLTTASSGEQMLAFKFLDRRHRWTEGFIEGEYNVRDGEAETDPIKPSTKKSARELALLCFEAMLEQKPVVTALPDDRYPEVSWSGTPAAMLSELCELASCRIVFDPFSNRTKIHRIGIGAPLPNGPTISDDYGQDSPELPDVFEFIAAPTWHETDLELEAVTEDPDQDDKIVPIDDVKWKPRGGWKHYRPPELGVATKYAETAKKCVYRWYRPKLPIKVWGQKVEDLWRILPLLDHRAGVHFLDEDDENRGKLGAALYGKYIDGHESGTIGKGDQDTVAGKMRRFERGFSIDGAQGLVQSGEPLYRLVVANTDTDVKAGADPRKTQVKPAKLWLRVAVQFRDEETGAFIRHKVEQKTKGKKLGSPPHVIGREDVRLVKWKNYTGNGAVEKDNEKAVEAIAKGYLIDELNAYTTKESGTRTYPGLLRFACDGAITQISWSVDDSGHSNTQISREREELGAALTFRQSRERQALRESIKRDKRKANK